MAAGVRRGEVWLYTFAAPDKRRPVLVLSRQKAIEMLRTVLVAPITSSIHGSPSEVLVGIEEGLKNDCAVNLDQVQTVDQVKLRHLVGSLKPAKMSAVCKALQIATGCTE